ncbi:MAG: DedA family protein [Bacteroidaceae bacterium]|nr:DedA family protein [Bacteroidaceae bacterium]
MENFTDFFVTYGYWGMGLAAFLAGSFIPFSSEAVMAALLATTSMDPVLLLVSATIGNTAGSMFNYCVGHLGDADRIGRWLRVKPRRLERAKRWVGRYGGWAGLITFLPILGSAISIALGIMRVNWAFVLGTTFTGKTLRYIIVAYTVLAMV